MKQKMNLRQELDLTRDGTAEMTRWCKQSGLEPDEKACVSIADTSSSSRYKEKRTR